ncbi:MAG TPA: ABC transporter permease [Candidatus Dormibacteraeota bacterium]|jgi:ABC-type nitrate/sulfonate/bicarbonate transport system permease component|nr:ABC transporter permease [Candidatus Dormibacteraeota bacterium]
MATSLSLDRRAPSLAPPPEVVERERRRRRSRRRLMWTVRVLSVGVVLAAWQLYGARVNPILFAPPSAIAQAFVAMVRDGTLLGALLQSLLVLVVGLGAAIVVSIPAALVWARYDPVDWAVQHYVNAIYATPLVALVPLLILWFGLGFLSRAIIVFSFAFFPLLLNVYQGAKSVDRELLEVARSFRSREYHVWRHVVLPSSVPFIMAGLNLAAGRSLVGLIIAEFYTTGTGLGYLVLQAANTFRTARMFVPVIVVMVLGVALLGLTRYLQRKVAPWSGPPERQ